jgi:GH15 family glucan-1,4-alpha-glucosidase
MNSIQILKQLQNGKGLFLASSQNVTTGYNRAWIRDNIYEALGMEAAEEIEAVIRTYHALFDILLKHEYKIDWAIRKKPSDKMQYIHARFNPETLQEIPHEWGNKQNDATGAFLFKVADLMEKGIEVIRNKHDVRILRKLVKYLEKIEYWHDADNGMWEEYEEVHASSVGACVAGLKKVSKFIEVPKSLIEKGQETLNELLPRESETKRTDLSLLSLIYPYNVVSEEQKELILKDIENILLRNKGVIRYEGDKYYSTEDGEAEWTFGLPWLAKIYKEMGDTKKYLFYMRKTKEAMTINEELPELYFAGTDVYNENTPLGWSQAMYLVALSDR